MEDKKIPHLFYLHLHSKIWESSMGEIISKKEATTYLYNWRIPKQLRHLIIRELEILGLVRRLDRRTLELSKPNFDINNLKEYEKKLNIFS